MISVEMEDVLAVLQLCKPYIIGIVAALVIGIVIMIACRRMCRDKKFLIRREAAIAMVLAVVVCVNMICFGPMATLIGLATGSGTISRSEERRVGKECRSRWSAFRFHHHSGHRNEPHPEQVLQTQGFQYNTHCECISGLPSMKPMKQK